MGGRGAGRAIGLWILAAQQELRPPGIGRIDDGPKSATAPSAEHKMVERLSLHSSDTTITQTL
jgi:hypothetical protein